MPLPKPLKREKENDFIGRCVPLVLESEGLDKDVEKERKQAVAICYTRWRKARGGKAMEMEDLAGLSFDVDGEDVVFEDLIEAYKVHKEVAGNEALKAVTKKEKDGQHPAGHYLVVEDSKKVTTWHLRVKDINGKLDHRLMGAAWAALHGGYRGNKYEGPDKAKAIIKLKKLYKQEDMELPGKSLDELGEDKSLSFGARINVVRRAFEQMSRPPKMPVAEATGDYWYIDSDDIFDDYVIAKSGEKEAYKVPYTMDKDDNVEFAAQDKWEKVEREWVPSKAMDYCVKRLGETDAAWCIGSYGLYWGSPKKRDLSPWQNKDGSKGEFFTLQTQGLDDLPIKVITFEHDKEKGPEPECEPIRHSMGTTILERDDAIGRWIEAHIEKRRKYATYVMDLVDRNELSFSSETAGHWREVADNGEIKRWRTAGYTLTTHPMEPRLTDVEHLRAYYKSLDLDLAEPDTGGAGEKPGLETEKAIAEIELLLLDIDMEEKT